MQKFIARLSVVLFSLLIAFPILNAKAYEVTVDQSNTTISQASVVIYNYGHNQTFTPKYDVLTKLQVYLKDRSAGGNIILTVKDDTAGTTVLTRNQRMDDGTGWEVFDFTGGDSLGFVLTPGNQHSIWLETSYYSADPVPKWVRSDHNAYSGGMRRQNSTEYADDDFAFATFGYAFEEEQQTQDGTVPDENTNTDTTTPPDSTQETTNQDESGTTTEDEEITTEQAEDSDLDTIGLEDQTSDENDTDDRSEESENGLSTLAKILLVLFALFILMLLVAIAIYFIYRDKINAKAKELYNKYFKKSRNDKKSSTSSN